jgi:hypothetical protein
MLGVKVINGKPVTSDSIHTREYRKKRAKILERDRLCTLGLPGCTGLSEEVDHIIPRAAVPAFTLSEDNMRGVCRSCHKQRSNQGAAAPRRLSRALRMFNFGHDGCIYFPPGGYAVESADNAPTTSMDEAVRLTFLDSSGRRLTPRPGPAPRR